LLKDPDLEGAVNAELGYTSGLAYYLRGYMDQVTGLLDELEEAERR
jgi:hypothetical protein